ncbi:hypothetical protein [Arthrobacter woluwensis]|uniref:hypothetical protein n=1 Tax=Arthrobacter woluwensis TaxID=156980 RepID=UPI0011AB1721|nr:hypothetical protein [Arthrobacter woluwensis]
MTAPYLPDTIDLVRGSHTQRVTITLTDGTTTWTARALSGTLTYAEDYSPGVRLSAAIPNNFTPAELAKLDPRNRAVTVTVDAGYIWPDGTEDIHTVFTGQLDNRVARTPGAVVDINASSAETLTQESGWMGDEVFQTYNGVREAVTAWLAYALGKAPLVTTNIAYGTRPDLVTGVQVSTGTDMWSLIDQVTNAADLRVYVDDSGAWHLEAKPRVAGVTSAFLSMGNGGIVTDSTDTLSRDGYYTSAVLVYEWTDAGGTDRKVIGKYGAAAGKTYSARLTIPVTQAVANAAALVRVRNLSTRGAGYQLTGVPCWWLRPGHTVEVSLANGSQARHIAREITFDLTGATMTVTTREPANLGT